MTFPASSLYAANLLAGWSAGATDIDIDGASRLKIALYNDSMVQDPTGGTALGYSATGEVSGAGYTATGKVLGGTVTWAVNSGLLVCSTSAVTDWTGATLSNIYGCVIYDDSATSPIADACIVAIKFGTVGSSGGGTFTIDWADTPVTNTIFTIDPTP